MCWPEEGLHKASLPFSPRLWGESIVTKRERERERIALYPSICQEKGPGCPRGLLRFS